MRSCCVLSGGAGRGRLIIAGERTDHQAVRDLLCIFPFFLIFFLSVLLLLLFASFAVLLNCPYPEGFFFILTHKFCLFLPILLPTPPGGRGNRMAAWSFVAGRGQTMTMGMLLAPEISLKGAVLYRASVAHRHRYF